MRPLFVLLFVAGVLLTDLHAQSETSRHTVSYKWHVIDTRDPSTTYFKGSWPDTEALTMGAEIGYTYGLNRSFNVHVPFRLGLIGPGRDEDQRLSPRVFTALDATLQLKMLPDHFRLNPYLMAGVGGSLREKEGLSAQLPLGAGLHIRTDFGINLNTQLEYRIGLNGLPDHIMASMGICVPFGQAAPKVRDADGDGVPDKEDECPFEAGDPLLKGCPDRDGDGIADHEDRCPDEAGPASLRGCPDRDKDGVADRDDRCPDQPGPVSLKGCPDTDGDGIADKDDRCPQEAGPSNLQGCPDRDNDGVADIDDLCPDQPGPASNQGCPEDRDGDGVLDADDLCPETPGPAANRGCPLLSAEDIAVVAKAVEQVQFLSNSNQLTPSSYPVLDQLARVLIKNNAYHCFIGGHTDATGGEALNQELSERRARACVDYLMSKGVPEAQLTAQGFGQTRPIADNRTPEGRRANRRVEFDLRIP